MGLLSSLGAQPPESQKGAPVWMERAWDPRLQAGKEKSFPQGLEEVRSASFLSLVTWLI